MAACFVILCPLPVLPPSLQATKIDKQSSVPEGDYDNTVNDAELEDSGYELSLLIGHVSPGEGQDSTRYWQN